MRSDSVAISKKTAEASMTRQGLQGRVRKHKRGLTRADAQTEDLPDLFRTGFHR